MERQQPSSESMLRRPSVRFGRRYGFWIANSAKILRSPQLIFKCSQLKATGRCDTARPDGRIVCWSVRLRKSSCKSEFSNGTSDKEVKPRLSLRWVGPKEKQKPFSKR